MKCIVPPPITEEQISIALDGAADLTIQQHLSECPSCAGRVVEARGFEETLRTQLYRWDCPPPQQLGDYHLGSVARSAELRIRRHLEQCASCTAEVEQLRVFLGSDDLAAPTVPAVPAQTSSRAFRQRVRELVARVTPSTPAFALRGAATGPIVAEAGNTTIVIDVQAARPGNVTLMGQIVTEDQQQWTGALLELRQGGRLLATATIDDLGSFSSESLPTGQTELRFTAVNGQTVVLPAVDLSV